MKKWTTTVICAAVAAGFTNFPVHAEDMETVISDHVMFNLTVDNEYAEAELIIEYDQDKNAELSVRMSASESATGEKMEQILEDIVRIVDGDTYINIDLLIDAYYEITGDMSMTMLAAMAGLDEPWLVIPEIEIPVSEEAMIPEMSDALAEDLVNCIALFDVVQNEETIEIPICGQDVAQLLKQLNAVGHNHGEELENLIRAKVSAAEVLDYKEVFADYIFAVAEGISEVIPEMDVETSTEEVEEIVDAFANALVFDINIFGTVPLEDADKVFGELEGYLTEDVFNGLISINDESVRLELAVSDGESHGDMMIEFTSVTEGRYAEIAAPETATELRDVVKNAVIIYYSMMIPEETSDGQ